MPERIIRADLNNAACRKLDTRLIRMPAGRETRPARRSDLQSAAPLNEERTNSWYTFSKVFENSEFAVFKVDSQRLSETVSKIPLVSNHARSKIARAFLFHGRHRHQTASTNFAWDMTGFFPAKLLSFRAECSGVEESLEKGKLEMSRLRSA